MRKQLAMYSTLRMQKYERHPKQEMNCNDRLLFKICIQFMVQSQNEVFFPGPHCMREAVDIQRSQRAQKPGRERHAAHAQNVKKNNSICSLNYLDVVCKAR